MKERLNSLKASEIGDSGQVSKHNIEFFIYYRAVIALLYVYNPFEFASGARRKF